MPYAYRLYTPNSCDWIQIFFLNEEVIGSLIGNTEFINLIGTLFLIGPTLHKNFVLFWIELLFPQGLYTTTLQWVTRQRVIEALASLTPPKAREALD